MQLENITIEEFMNFQENHPLSNFYQTINYAMLMAEHGYDYELVGLKQNNEILAASLILIKPIGIKCFYGYAPRGFLIDYNNDYLLNIFTQELKKYFYEKNVIFIKVNPNLPIGYVNKDTFITDYNLNHNLLPTFQKYNYKKLADNLYFEAMLPRFTGIIDLKNYDSKLLNKNTRNKIKKGIRKGLNFEIGKKDDIHILYELMKKSTVHSEYFYQDVYTVFEKDNNIDLFLVSIDYDAFLQNSQYMYDLEQEKNNKLNNRLVKYSNEKNINAKMHSDKNLLTYKNDIMEATKGMINNKKIYLAAALVVKHQDTVTILYSAHDKEYKRFAPNYFLHYNIIKYYQNAYDYLDLNGLVGDFKNENKYTGLNRFKFGLNPIILEYIGEFDLIIEQKSYDILLKNGILAKEFKKNE